MSDFDPDIPVVEQLVAYPTMKRLVDQMLHGVFLLNASGAVQYANNQWERTVGQRYADFMDLEWIRLFEPKEQKRVRAGFNHLVKTGETLRIDTVVQRLDDSQRLIRLQIVPFADESGEMAYLGTVDDYTTQFQLARAAEENERRLSIMLEVMSEGVVLQDSKGQIIVSNPAAEQILGLTSDQMAGRTSTDPCWRSIREDGSDYPGTEHPAMRSLETGEHFHNQLMGVHKPGGVLTWISVNSVPIYDGVHKVPYAVVGSFSDVTELKNAKDELEKKFEALHLVQVELEVQQRELQETNARLRQVADTDVLTGLKNRRNLFERLRAEAALAERNGSTFSFALFDIDFFKSINDQYGHAAGDEVLRRVADTLKDCARISDFVARYGGEEFAMILPHTAKASAGEVVNRILREIRRIHWQGRLITASAGISTYGISNFSVDALIEEADRALYAAKDAGRDQVILAA